MTKEGPCHGMTIKPWQAEVWFRLGPERINVPIQFFFFFSLSLVLSVFLLQPPPHKLVRRESGRGCCGSGEAGWVPPAWLIPWWKGCVGPRSALTSHRKGQSFPSTSVGLSLLVGKVIPVTSHHPCLLIFPFTRVPAPRWTPAMELAQRVISRVPLRL